jgi:hypothetical protein
MENHIHHMAILRMEVMEVRYHDMEILHMEVMANLTLSMVTHFTVTKISYE